MNVTSESTLPVQPPPSSGSVTASISATTAATAFDDILPLDFAGKSKPKDGDLVGSSDTSKSTPKLQPKLAKTLTGLEILDEEISSRLVATSSQPVASFPVLPPQPLVPEPATVDRVSSTSSLEKFGDFGGYSGENASGDPTRGDPTRGDTAADVDSNSGSVTSLTGWSKVSGIRWASLTEWKESKEHGGGACVYYSTAACLLRAQRKPWS